MNDESNPWRSPPLVEPVPDAEFSPLVSGRSQPEWFEWGLVMVLTGVLGLTGLFSSLVSSQPVSISETEVLSCAMILGGIIVCAVGYKPKSKADG